MRKTPLTLPLVIGKKVVRNNDGGWYAEGLTPVEVEYVCRRASNRNRALNSIRDRAAEDRRAGLARKYNFHFTATQTFHDELKYIVTRREQWMASQATPRVDREVLTLMLGETNKKLNRLRRRSYSIEKQLSA
jgi:hypothetical protein